MGICEVDWFSPRSLRAADADPLIINRKVKLINTQNRSFQPVREPEKNIRRLNR